MSDTVGARADAGSLDTESAEESPAPFAFNDRRSRLDNEDEDDANRHDTDGLQGSSPQARATTVHNSSSRSHSIHRFAASLHTPFQGTSAGPPSPPETAQRSSSSNGVYLTAATAGLLSNGQLGTATITPARLTPLRRVNLVESRASTNRIGATSFPLSSGINLKHGGLSGSNAGFHQSPPPAATSRKWLVLIKGPPILPHSPPPNEASGFARAYGASGRYDGGVLLPLQHSVSALQLSAQVALIAREFSLPSIGGVALYLCLNNATRSNDSTPFDRRRSRATSASLSTGPGDVSSRPASILSTNECYETGFLKPRILEETWGSLWSAFLDPLEIAGEGVQGPFGPSLAIAGVLEFDIDPRRAHWLASCYASFDSNQYHHSALVAHPSASMSTPTLSAPPLRHAARGSELAHRALQRNRSGSQVTNKGRGTSLAYVWHQPDEQEQRSTAAARSTNEVPHALVRSSLGGHFGDRDDSNFDSQLDKSLKSSERGNFGGMMLRDMNDVGFEDEDQDSEESQSDEPSGNTSHDDSMTMDVELLHDLRTMAVGSGSAAFESFDHFLTSTPGPSSAARQLSTQDSDGWGSPKRQGDATSGYPEPLTERLFLEEPASITLVENDEGLTSFGPESDHNGVELVDLAQKHIAPRRQASRSDTEQVNSGNKSSKEFEGNDGKKAVGNTKWVMEQSIWRGSSPDLKKEAARNESAAPGNDLVPVTNQIPSLAAQKQVETPATNSQVTYPYFQLYPPHRPYFASPIELPSTPSLSSSFSKSMSSPNRRGATPSPLRLEEHRTGAASTSSFDFKEGKTVSENNDQEAPAREDIAAGQHWDETTPQDAIFAEYAQVSPSRYDELPGFEASSGIPQEVDLGQVDEVKLKNGASEDSSMLASPSRASTSSSSGSSVSTTFERALKTSGHRNILSLGESDNANQTGSDIMPLSALFRPPPSGHFESSFDFQPGSTHTASRRPSSPTLNATELNSTSNISAFVRAMGHPDDGISFVLPTHSTEDLEEPLDVGEDSMDSEMGTDKSGRPAFDLQQGVPVGGLLVGIEEVDDDDDDEDSDDEGIELGEDQSCQIFDHLPSSPALSVVAEVSNPQQQMSAVQA
ncbi:BQ2448_1465 [Microbotryum intermedium]|uniref:BQ2448_1465 protein n=1 Tax=Microbotryum intermedium TaxID=269621 RepID=A0A238FD83_9BASI|nr:BQ2448_1465 [Microbotryum intermedium]